MTTRVLTAKEIRRERHTIDATGQILGRLATEVAALLIGKHKVLNASNLDNGDLVLVTNIKALKVTGNKVEDKIYRRHTGFPQGDRQRTLRELMILDPKEALRKAVWGMLPNNKLRNDRIKHLKIEV